MSKHSSTYLNFILPFCLFVSVVTGSLCVTAEDIEEPTESSPDVQENKSGIITANTLNVRARPGTNYEVVGKLKKGRKVEIVSKKNGWYEIKPHSHIEAWCAKEYLSPEGEVLSEKLRVRAGPGVLFSTYGRLPKGTKVVTKDRESDEWQLIQPPPQATVWISADYVKVPEKEKENKETTPDEHQKKTEKDKKTLDSEQAEADKEEEDTIAEKEEVKEADKEIEEQTEETAREDTDTNEKAQEKEDEQTQEEEIVAQDVTDEITDEQIKTEEEAESEPKDKNTVGVLIPLKEQKVGNITHALADIKEHSAYPKLLLQSSKINLSQWEYKKVRVYGRKTDERKKNRDVYSVTGIKLVNP